MKRWFLIIWVLGLTVTAWGEERAPNLVSRSASWGRRSSVKDWNGERTPNPTTFSTHPRREPIGSDGVIPSPYVGWVSNYPGYYTTSLGPGGTVGNFTGNLPADTAHWYRYWLGPNEFINWRINSSNPAVTKYNAFLYQSVGGQPGALLTQAVGWNNPDSIVYQNGYSGSYVLLKLDLARGSNTDDYTLWGTGSAPQNSPYYLSNFALNGATQNGYEITDGVEARMISRRYDNWYYWYWPDAINDQPVAAIKLDLAFDSTRINLDLYAVSPNLDTLLAGTNGPHYSAGTGWVTKETGWIYRSPGDTTGLWLHVHTTNDYGHSQVYRINNATAMTSSGVEVAYPTSPMDGTYLDAYPGMESQTNYYYTQYNYTQYNYSQEPPQPAPPPDPRPWVPPVRARASGPVIAKPLPDIQPAPIPPVYIPPVLTPVIRPPQRIQAPVQSQQPVKPQQPVVNIVPPSPQPQPPTVAPAQTPGANPGGDKNQ